MRRKQRTIVSERQLRNRIREDAAHLEAEHLEGALIHGSITPPLQPTPLVESEEEELGASFHDSPPPPHDFADSSLQETVDLHLLTDCDSQYDSSQDSYDSYEYGSDPEGEPEGEDRREDWDFGEWEDEYLLPPAVTEQEQLIRDLAAWTVYCNIPRTHVNKLLVILRKHPSYESIPKDYRTLLKSVRNVPVKLVDPGSYFHFGIAKGLSRSLQTLGRDMGSDIEIFVNIDGIPIAKSGSSQFWPILGKIAWVKRSKPFIIGVYWGPKKPIDVNIYLADFVEEATLLEVTGFEYCLIIVFVTIVAFICDRPALSFILSIKGHTGYFSCLKCVTKGVSYRPNVNKRNSIFIVFPELNAPLRTDASFRSRENPQHHLPGSSLLENLFHFNLVGGVLLDGMHVTDLGAMKKLILHYIKGKYQRVRMSRVSRAILAHRISECRKYVPSEFPRKIESLEFVGQWKATSYRMVKLYLGPVLLKNLIRDDLFDHFLLFHTAMKLLSDETKCFKPEILI